LRCLVHDANIKLSAAEKSTIDIKKLLQIQARGEGDVLVDGETSGGHHRRREKLSFKFLNGGRHGSSSLCHLENTRMNL
jgi:hypothetical protein